MTNSNLITVHPNYNFINRDNDLAVVRSATNFAFSNTVRAASIPGANNNVGDNVVLWAIGWGSTSVK